MTYNSELSLMENLRLAEAEEGKQQEFLVKEIVKLLRDIITQNNGAESRIEKSGKKVPDAIDQMRKIVNGILKKDVKDLFFHIKQLKALTKTSSK